VLKRHHVRVEEVGVTRNLERRRRQFSLVTTCPEKLPEEALVSDLSGLPDVIEVRLE